MRQFAIVTVTVAVLCLPVPAIAQGFQFGSDRASWDIRFERSPYPCYRLNSHSSFTYFHDVDRGFQPHSDRKKFYTARANWDEGKYWPGEKRPPRCLGLWESQ